MATSDLGVPAFLDPTMMGAVENERSGFDSALALGSPGFWDRYGLAPR